MRSPRVFVGLFEIAGYYAGLTRGLRELGVEVSHVTITESSFYGCPSARGSWAVGLSNACARAFTRAQKRRITRWPFKPVRWLHLRLLFLWAIARHDVFIFSYGLTFFDRKELPLLKRLGKKLIFVFNGSDSRPPYLNGWFVAEPVDSWAKVITATADMKQMVREIEQHADHCINHPLSAHFHEKPFVNYIAIGNPGYVDVAAQLTDAAARPPEPAGPRPVRVLHAPSRPALKGSPQFRAMVDRLNARGARIDYVELRNRPHAEVLAELASCDFVLDELYSDFSLAGLGTEAASFGKPALVGGYGTTALQQARRAVPLPLDTYCHPDELEATFERLLTDTAWRRTCGETARNFVRENWQPRVLAQKYLALINGTPPRAWLFDPRDIVYLHGWGVSEETLRRRLADLIQSGGVPALQLSDKPHLERALVEFTQAAPRQPSSPRPANPPLSSA